eukprot:UN01582
MNDDDYHRDGYNLTPSEALDQIRHIYNSDGHGIAQLAPQLLPARPFTIPVDPTRPIIRRPSPAAYQILKDAIISRESIVQTFSFTDTERFAQFNAEVRDCTQCRTETKK